MDDEWSTRAMCTALLGAVTVLGVLRHLARSVLGTNGRITMRGKHGLVTGGSSGIGKEVAKVRATVASAHRSHQAVVGDDPSGLQPARMLLEIEVSRCTAVSRGCQRAC